MCRLRRVWRRRLVRWSGLRGLSAVHFVKLELRDAEGKMLSENFYWRALPEHQDDLTALDSMPTGDAGGDGVRKDSGGRVSWM